VDACLVGTAKANARVETGKGLRVFKTLAWKKLADNLETQVIDHATNWMEAIIILGNYPLISCIKPNRGMV